MIDSMLRKRLRWFARAIFAHGKNDPAGFHAPDCIICVPIAVLPLPVGEL